jgi:signal transduction histidine kinase
MKPEQDEPTPLSIAAPKGSSPVYPWIGLLVGAGVVVLLGYPLVLVINHFHDHYICGLPLTLSQAILRGLTPRMWPFMLLYALSGGLAGLIVGLVFRRIQENRLRLDNLHHEFELQVTTLRHHYKNLALGIQGFSYRLKRKAVNLEDYFLACARDDCRIYDQFYQDFKSLQQSVEILEGTSQRLTHTLGQELLFLRALTSNTPAVEPREFYAFLERCLQDLLDLRFRDKPLRVEINGLPLGEPQESLIFFFDPHIMEVILQNILSNAMKHGDHIQIRVKEKPDKVYLEVEDNGPGLDIGELHRMLLAPTRSRDAESTHLGLKVTLHLLEKCQGRLLAFSEPGKGAVFILEIPKQPMELRANQGRDRLGIFRRARGKRAAL